MDILSIANKTLPQKLLSSPPPQKKRTQGKNSIFKNIFTQRSRDGLVVKECWLFFQRTWFDSQNLYGSSQLSITAVSENLMPNLDLCGYQACTWYTDSHVKHLGT